MSNDDIRHVEVITCIAGRRYWPAHEKLRIIGKALSDPSDGGDGAAVRGIKLDGGDCTGGTFYRKPGWPYRIWRR